ncbi:MAG: hypothetical protein WC862_00810 [Patescibacteria group bacterium]
MAIKKIWTSQNGAVGTAHLNREGKLVDFRPAKAGFNGKFLFEATDGWTPSTEVDVRVGGEESRLSEDGLCLHRQFRMSANFQGVALSATVTLSELTAAGREKERERQEEQRRLRLSQEAEAKSRREREPADMAELQAWVDARLADPLAGGIRPGRLLRKPSRARWVVGDFIGRWIEKFPLPEENQFAKRGARNLRSMVFRILQEKSGSKEWGAGGELIRQAVVRAHEAQRAAAREVRLSK